MMEEHIKIEDSNESSDEKQFEQVKQSWLKTYYFNYRMFPFAIARKLPSIFAPIFKAKIICLLCSVVF